MSILSAYIWLVYVHPVANSNVRDTGTDLLDDARRVDTKDSRVVRNKYVECMDLPVNRVECSGVNLDENLAGAGLLNVALFDCELAFGLEEVKSFLIGHVGRAM